MKLNEAVDELFDFLSMDPERFKSFLRILGRPDATRPTKWEYLTFHHPGVALHDLDPDGDEGWELVCVSQYETADEKGSIYYFKRPKPEDSAS